MVYKHLDGLLHLDGFQLFIEAQIKSKTIQVSFFFNMEMYYLEFKISAIGVQLDQDKVRTTLSVVILKTGKQV